jgi:hypothetical protein
LGKTERTHHVFSEKARRTRGQVKPFGAKAKRCDEASCVTQDQTISILVCCYYFVDVRNKSDGTTAIGTDYSSYGGGILGRDIFTINIQNVKSMIDGIVEAGTIVRVVIDTQQTDWVQSSS